MVAAAARSRGMRRRASSCSGYGGSSGLRCCGSCSGGRGRRDAAAVGELGRLGRHSQRRGEGEAKKRPQAVAVGRKKPVVEREERGVWN